MEIVTLTSKLVHFVAKRAKKQSAKKKALSSVDLAFVAFHFRFLRCDYGRRLGGLLEEMACTLNNKEKKSSYEENFRDLNILKNIVILFSYYFHYKKQTDSPNKPKLNFQLKYHPPK